MIFCCTVGCEWEGGVLFGDVILVMGCWFRDVWWCCCRCELSECVNGVLTVRCILFLFYLCAL